MWATFHWKRLNYYNCSWYSANEPAGSKRQCVSTVQGLQQERRGLTVYVGSRIDSDDLPTRPHLRPFLTTRKAA